MPKPQSGQPTQEETGDEEELLWRWPVTFVWYKNNGYHPHTTRLSMEEKLNTLKNSSVHEKPLKEYWKTQNGGLCSRLLHYILDSAHNIRFPPSVQCFRVFTIKRFIFFPNKIL